MRPSPGSEAAHLHRLQDKAVLQLFTPAQYCSVLCQVAVCRAPTLTAFVFSLPDCRLLQTVSTRLEAVLYPTVFCAGESTCRAGGR